MTVNVNKNPAYLDALKEFTCFLNTELRNGGKVPGVREMCKRLNISSRTYLKITSILKRENILKANKGCVGTYVIPAAERHKKIGMIYCNGKISPFFGTDPVLSEFLQTLNHAFLPIHMIQAASMNKLYENALVHSSSAIVWIHPPAEAVPIIREIQNTNMPILLLTQCSDRMEHTTFNGVWPDLKKENMNILDFLEKKQKKSILAYSMFCEKSEMQQLCKERGISFHQFPEKDIQSFVKHLPELLEQYKPDVIFSGCGYFKAYRDICETLSTFPKKNRPDLLLAQTSDIPENFQKIHPDLTLLGRIEFESGRIGKAGAEMILDLIRKEKPLFRKTENTAVIIPS